MPTDQQPESWEEFMGDLSRAEKLRLMAEWERDSTDETISLADSLRSQRFNEYPEGSTYIQESHWGTFVVCTDCRYRASNDGIGHMLMHAHLEDHKRDRK